MDSLLWNCKKASRTRLIWILYKLKSTKTSHSSFSLELNSIKKAKREKSWFAVKGNLTIVGQCFCVPPDDDDDVDGGNNTREVKNKRSAMKRRAPRNSGRLHVQLISHKLIKHSSRVQVRLFDWCLCVQNNFLLCTNGRGRLLHGVRFYLLGELFRSSATHNVSLLSPAFGRKSVSRAQKRDRKVENEKFHNTVGVNLHSCYFFRSLLVCFGT